MHEHRTFLSKTGAKPGVKFKLTAIRK